MRAFLAIELPDPVRAELALAQRRLRAALGDEAVGWTPAENWHLTLQFLGAVADPAPVVEAARVVCAARAPLELALGPLGTFGARVVWVGLTGPGVPDLVDLAAALGQALAPLGFALDDRPYAPHVTLGRVRDAGRERPARGGKKGTSRGVGPGAVRPPAAGAGAVRPPAAKVTPTVRATPGPAALDFVAGEVVLMESRLSPPEPATYVPHARLPLGPGCGDTRPDSRADLR